MLFLCSFFKLFFLLWFCVMSLFPICVMALHCLCVCVCVCFQWNLLKKVFLETNYIFIMRRGDGNQNTWLFQLQTVVILVGTELRIGTKMTDSDRIPLDVEIQLTRKFAKCLFVFGFNILFISMNWIQTLLYRKLVSFSCHLDRYKVLMSKWRQCFLFHWQSCY